MHSGHHAASCRNQHEAVPSSVATRMAWSLAGAIRAAAASKATSSGSVRWSSRSTRPPSKFFSFSKCLHRQAVVTS